MLCVCAAVAAAAAVARSVTVWPGAWCSSDAGAALDAGRRRLYLCRLYGGCITVFTGSKYVFVASRVGGVARCDVVRCGASGSVCGLCAAMGGSRVGERAHHGPAVCVSVCLCSCVVVFGSGVL